VHDLIVFPDVEGLDLNNVLPPSLETGDGAMTTAMVRYSTPPAFSTLDGQF
jgi:hypothetical protein